MKGLSSRLKEVRIKSLLSQTKFASKLKMSQAQYGKYEAGNSSPSVPVLIRINEVFKVDLHWLITGEDRYELER